MLGKTRQQVVWDVTYVETLAESYLFKTSLTAGAEIACKKNKTKYTKIKLSHYVLKALAFETLGPWAEETSNFINRIGTLLVF